MAVGVTFTAVAATAAEEEDDDEEGEGEGVVTTITTTTATGETSSTTTTTLEGGLPCNPVIKNQDAMTYYLCGEQHFVLAYGGTGPVYIPVPAP